MLQDGNHSSAELLASLPDSERQELLASLTDAEAAGLDTDWGFWSRPSQRAPDGDWLTWLILAGRGFGKTRTGAEWVRGLVCGSSPLSGGTHGRIALVAETAADARDVMVEGESGLLAIHPRDFRPLYEPSKRRLTWPNGAIATLFNAVEPDQLRGPQQDAAWCDELAKWRYAQETWDQLQFGLRLGSDPRQCITTTPRPIPTLRQIMRAESTVITRGSTFDNKANLAPAFFTQVVERYQGTRLGRQELNAEVLDDVPGALWSRAMLDEARVTSLPEMQRIVVAVDPSGAKDEGDEKSDAIGIIVAGRGVDGLGYIIADRTIVASPATWGRRAVAAFHEFQADRIIGEENYGGAMVEHVVRTADQGVSYKAVNASRGKVLRAEPVASLYEQGRVKHFGDLSELEDELCQFSGSGYLGKGSPNRADAAVWALTDLFPPAALPKRASAEKLAPGPRIKLQAPSGTGWMG